MAGLINTGSIAKDLLPGVQKFFGLAYNDFPKVFDKIFRVDSTKEIYQEDVIMRGLGLLSTKGQGESVHYDSMSQGWTKRYEQVTLATAFSVSKEAMDYTHMLNLAADGAKQMRRAVLQTDENLCANVLNRAFTAGYVGGDGIVLCSTAHPTYVGGNLANRIGTDADISEAALEQAVVDINAFVDERGLKAMVIPDKLVVTSSDQFNAERILKNVQRPATADRDINAMVSMNMFPGGIIVNRYLTDADAWFVVTDCDKGLRFIEGRAPEISSEDDFDTESAKFKLICRRVVGWSDPRGVYGSSGA